MNTPHDLRRGIYIPTPLPTLQTWLDTLGQAHPPWKHPCWPEFCRGLKPRPVIPGSPPYHWRPTYPQYGTLKYIFDNGDYFIRGMKPPPGVDFNDCRMTWRGVPLRCAGEAQ